MKLGYEARRCGATRQLNPVILTSEARKYFGARESTFAELAVRDSAPAGAAPGLTVRLEALIEDYFDGAHDDGLAVWRAYTPSLWLEGFGLA